MSEYNEILKNIHEEVEKLAFIANKEGKRNAFKQDCFELKAFIDFFRICDLEETESMVYRYIEFKRS